MRDLKFRAWIKNENKMGEVTQLSFNTPCGSIFAVSVDSTPVGFFKKDDIELLQYTGLKDNNGKEIFEGDIVKGWLGYTCDDVAVIEYEEDSIGFVCSPIYEKDFGKTFEFPYDVEVIGNIFENKANDELNYDSRRDV